jgi:signal transduction histidine kinase
MHSFVVGIFSVLRTLVGFGLVFVAGLAWSASSSDPDIFAPAGEVTVLDQACLIADSSAVDLPQASADWLHVKLPHRWMDTHPSHNGTMWYRFKFKLSARPQGNWAVYLPRVVMNAQVWVNDVPLGYTGSMVEPVTRNWYVPLLFPVPAKLLKAGENELYVRVASGYESRDGLAPIQIGPVEPLAQIHRWRQWVQVDALHVIHVALITLGALMIVVWMRDRGQTAFGYMGMSAVFWGLSTLMLISPSTWTSLPVWEILCGLTMNWYQLALCAFFFRFAEVSSPWLYRLIGALAVLAMPYYCAWSSYIGITWILAGIYCLALSGMAVAICSVIRHGRPDGWWLVLGCACLVPAGWHDVLIRTGALPFDSVYWLGLFGPLLIACCFVILVGDYARSRQALFMINRDLSVRVAERETALRESFERLADLERSQAVSAERSRILQDMHDGVGAHLTSALRQIQSPPGQAVDMPLVAQTLRDSLDQLKMSIDAMSLQSGDIAGLLASWRFRLAPRLKAAGLELVWDVDDLPLWPAGHYPVMRQLQYILYEGLSNVLQHSGASRLVLSAGVVQERLRVSLIDNGKGLNGHASTSGQGFQTMLGRARHIGAELTLLTPESGGLELRIDLPLDESNAASLSLAA